MTRPMEKFANSQREGRSHVSIALGVFNDIFFPAPPPPPEPAKLRVFAAGLPRTGTGSLAAALAALGFRPCYGPGAFELAPMFARHHSGAASRSDLVAHGEELGFDAQGFDMLGWKLWREAAGTPDVKVILTEHPRGGVGWAESYSSFVPDSIRHFSERPFAFMDAMIQIMTLQRECLSYISRLGGNEKAITDPRDPFFTFPWSSLISSYEEHKRAVIEAVPEERLLIFKPTEGWAPLCEFLEVDGSACPTEIEYPKMTDREMMITMSKVALVLTWIWPLILCLLIAVPVGLCTTLYSRKKKKKKLS